MTAILVSFETAHPPMFPLGELVATTSVASEIPTCEIASALLRHARGDWGESNDEQARINRYAWEAGGKIVSEFTSKSGTKFVIVTEASHYVTTVMLPEEE